MDKDESAVTIHCQIGKICSHGFSTPGNSYTFLGDKYKCSPLITSDTNVLMHIGEATRMKW